MISKAVDVDKTQKPAFFQKDLKEIISQKGGL